MTAASYNTSLIVLDAPSPFVIFLKTDKINRLEMKLDDPDIFRSNGRVSALDLNLSDQPQIPSPDPEVEPETESESTPSISHLLSTSSIIEYPPLARSTPLSPSERENQNAACNVAQILSSSLVCENHQESELLSVKLSKFHSSEPNVFRKATVGDIDKNQIGRETGGIESNGKVTATPAEDGVTLRNYQMNSAVPIGSTSNHMDSLVIDNGPQRESPINSNNSLDDSWVTVDTSGNELDPKILWVNNLHKSTSALQLKRLLSQYGKVIGLKVVLNARYSSSCYGYVVMNSTYDANCVIENLNNTEFNGQIIKISIYMDNGDETDVQNENRDNADNSQQEAINDDHERNNELDNINHDVQEASAIVTRLNDHHSEASTSRQVFRPNDHHTEASTSRQETTNSIINHSDGHRGRTRERSVDYNRTFYYGRNDRRFIGGSESSRYYHGRNERRGVSRSNDNQPNTTLDQRPSCSTNRNGNQVEILTFNKIKEERERQKLREQERALREDNRRRDEDNMYINEIIRQQLRDERDQLNIQKEKVEEERLKLLKLRSNRNSSELQNSNQPSSSTMTSTQTMSRNRYEFTRFYRNRHERPSYAGEHSNWNRSHYSNNRGNRSQYSQRRNYRHDRRRYDRYDKNHKDKNDYYNKYRD